MKERKTKKNISTTKEIATSCKWTVADLEHLETPNLPRFCWWARHYVASNIPLSGSGQLSYLCPLPASFIPLAYLLGEQSGKVRKPWYCGSTDQQQPKHWCVINSLLITNWKHSRIWAAAEEINSIPDRASRKICRRM